MGEQLIVSISREFGSGGHEIARKLADRLGLAFYDRCMLDEIAEQMNADVSDFHKYDEKPGNRFLSRRVGNHTNSYEEIIAFSPPENLLNAALVRSFFDSFFLV